MAIENDKYCITKDYNDESLTITSNFDICEISMLSSELVTTSLEYGVTEVNNCILNGVCDAGTAFAIKVNASKTYKFYVISDI